VALCLVGCSRVSKCGSVYRDRLKRILVLLEKNLDNACHIKKNLDNACHIKKNLDNALNFDAIFGSHISLSVKYSGSHWAIYSTEDNTNGKDRLAVSRFFLYPVVDIFSFFFAWCFSQNKPKFPHHSLHETITNISLRLCSEISYFVRKHAVLEYI
jgi:hypothetical protein